MSREAMEQIAQCTKLARDAISLAEDIADRHELDFSFSLGYGMGGYYDGEEQEWNSSSSNC